MNRIWARYFGKGLVESVFPLSNSTGIALTTALYYTPSGRSIQKPLKGADYALAATASKRSASARKPWSAATTCAAYFSG